MGLLSFVVINSHHFGKTGFPKRLQATCHSHTFRFFLLYSLQIPCPISGAAGDPPWEGHRAQSSILMKCLLILFCQTHQPLRLLPPPNQHICIRVWVTFAFEHLPQVEWIRRRNVEEEFEGCGMRCWRRYGCRSWEPLIHSSVHLFREQGKGSGLLCFKAALYPAVQFLAGLPS